MSVLDVSSDFRINKANLYPILPSSIRDLSIDVSPIICPRGTTLASGPSDQCQEWTVSTHPEGRCYAHAKSQAGITIVTEARIAEVSGQLNAWLAVIYDLIAQKQVHLPGTCDLFLEIHKDLGTCNYYFANHGLRTVFWLHMFDKISVGLPPPFSSSYLQYCPEENYWMHVELFPGIASQYSAKALNELQVIFSNAHADALTSEIAFPYTAGDCEGFTDLLERSKGRASSPNVVTFVARLWATVANHRFITHSSEEPKHGQLFSKIPTLEVPESKWGLALGILSKMLLFGIPDRYETRFKGFLEDQIVDPSRWREHASEAVEDLKQVMSSILAVLGASTLTSSSSGLIKASLFLCAFDLAVTSFLLQRQQRLLSTNIPTSVAYLKHWNTSCGFRPIAMVHSLPQALFVWALLLFSLQGFWMTFAGLPLTLCLSTLIPVAVIVVIVGLGIWFIVHPRPEPTEDAMLPLATPSSDPTDEQKERPTAESMV